MSRNIKQTLGRIGRGCALGAGLLAATAAGAQTWNPGAAPAAVAPQGYGVRGYLPGLGIYAGGSYFPGFNRAPGGSYFPGYGRYLGSSYAPGFGYYPGGYYYRPSVVAAPYSPYGTVTLRHSALGSVYGVVPYGVYDGAWIGGRYYPRANAYGEARLREELALRNALLYRWAAGYVQRAREDLAVPLTFKVEPPEAAVYLDGVYLGTAGYLNAAGWNLMLLPGTYALEVAAPGYTPVTAEVQVQAGQPVTVEQTLEKVPAK